MESQPQNPEFRNNPENFHPCILRGLGLEIQIDMYFCPRSIQWRAFCGISSGSSLFAKYLSVHLWVSSIQRVKDSHRLANTQLCEPRLNGPFVAVLSELTIYSSLSEQMFWVNKIALSIKSSQDYVLDFL